MTDNRSLPSGTAPDEYFPFKRLFLTGGSGYVGRNLIRHFVARGIEVIALVRSDTSADRVEALGAVACRADIFDPDLVARMSGCEALIHAAADTGHGPATKLQQRVNEDGTRAVLAVARAAGIRKAIHLSTEAVLATGKPLVNVDELMPLPRRPAGGYSRSSKAAAERAALAGNAAGFEVVVLRPRFVWGRDDTTALPNLLKAARSDRLAWIGGGTYRTSTTHIANLCHAVELALVKGRGGEVYFVSDDEPVEFKAFVSCLLATQGLAVPDKSVPRAVVRVIAAIGDLVAWISRGKIVPPLTLQSYAVSAVEISLDIGKARRELGYVPVLSREGGLAELRSDQHW
ncbi:NAD-dependent epimerase/dehydratase family protein [Ancylobacter sonchi]|uniref:NAD-dependent epimerase/dehydratase family protein n=1 Tax=Ancylobacter sonchi TaxID=1937790 RepID=UPI001BD2B987|nr:NAD-dependent epimerase/dehydratase family protein [Ancylobacter sonchi]MBS7534801.1 NAD-dependent epimerase/dehydratase family protein [Ancylobacter sonchi]